VLALLAESKANPQDDVPRLVLADWLDDQGGPANQARAELIRTQCRLAHLPEHEPERGDLEKWAQELENHHGRDWLGSLVDVANTWDFRRGLIDLVIRTHTFCTRAVKELPATSLMAWVERVRLRSLSLKGIPRLAGHPFLHLFTTLDLRSEVGSAGSQVMQVLASSTHLTHLAELRLHWIGDEGAQVLSASPHLLSNLTTLDLEANYLSPAGVQTLLSSPHLAHLTTLNLARNRVGIEGVRAIAHAPLLSQLTTLILGPSYIAIGDEGASILAGSPHLGRLTTLELGSSQDTVQGSMVGAAGVTALARSPHLAGLTRLNLAGNPIGPEGALALASSPQMAGLTALDLTSCRLGHTGVAALMASPHLTRLRVLKLGYNWYPDEGTAALLAESPSMASLATLHLEGNGINDSGALALARSPYFDGLRVLSLKGFHPGEGKAELRRRFGQRVRL
jgi:uncharacterized protein (TIGR02996 family)